MLRGRMMKNEINRGRAKWHRNLEHVLAQIRASHTMNQLDAYVQNNKSKNRGENGAECLSFEGDDDICENRTKTKHFENIGRTAVRCYQLSIYDIALSMKNELDPWQREQNAERQTQNLFRSVAARFPRTSHLFPILFLLFIASPFEFCDCSRRSTGRCVPGVLAI